ncbi:MAG: preprotein translocase subunit SecA [Patescibacteria group bacterium]|nr:MAG: preprotein translocase subunit SecA [Patescibacteria group bacterium]
MQFLKKLFNDESKKALKNLSPLIEKINSLEESTKKLSDTELVSKTDEFKERLNSSAGGGDMLDDILPAAFALVREAALRTLGQRHYDVQLMGGIVLHRGGISEMMTGEGKTLVATLPVYLNALAGRGVHVVTVNDYLSRRDAVWMGQIYSFLGLSISVINHDSSFIYDPGHKEVDEERDELGGFKVVYDFLRPCARAEAYAADITYGTNNEFGFDYLRDNIAYRKEDMVQRGHHYAIVDEIDSILIDEARTPLIISAPAQESEDLYKTFAGIAARMKEGADFTVDEKLRAISLTDEGITKAEKTLGIENIYTEKGIKYVHHLETAVRAKATFQKDKDYVVKDDSVIIVDEFTGRLQPGRRWSEGLHQAMEAKEGVDVQRESRTFASVTFQNYFRMYEKLAGMTGTAETSSEEFFKVYGLEVVSIPTNEPVARIDHGDLIFQTEQGKLSAIARKIKELNKKGQPVLVGTVSIEKNELLSAYLTKEGVTHEVLNAKQHEREGEVIAQAGRVGRVTIATNMAGRGVDIKLGGNPAPAGTYEEVKDLGGLFVLGTERHEARRTDDQLRGRAGRQGDPGETQFFVSLEDSLMRVFASDAIKKMMGRFGIPEDQPIENRLITKSLESAQTKIEGFHFDARKHVLEYDDVMNHQRKYIYATRRKFLMGDDAPIKEFLDGVAEKSDDMALEMKNKIRDMGEENFYEAARKLLLQIIDMLWMEHLEVMDYMRSSVNLRAYGQRDPLVEYKKEGSRLFKDLKESIGHHVIELLPNIGAGAFAADEKKVKEGRMQMQFSGSPQGDDASASPAPAPPSSPRRADGTKIGRNDPCPCGAINPETNEIYKYKKCGLIDAPHHRG